MSKLNLVKGNREYKLRGLPCPHCQNKVDIDIEVDDEGRVWVEELEKFNPEKYGSSAKDKK